MNYSGELIDLLDGQIKLKERIIKETGLPIERTTVRTFYSLYPLKVIDKSYEEWDIFDPVRIFKDVYLYEEYKPGKEYKEISTKSIDEVKDYVSILESAHFTEKNFITYFYVAVDKLFPSKYRIFAITDEILKPDEIKMLSKYCQCDICISPWYLPCRILSCRHCYGCLTSIETEIRGYNSLVEKTRNYINEQFKATSFL